MFRQYFRSNSRDVEDAAVIDGATPWQIYRIVVLPMARPMVITCGVLSFVYHWQEFLDPLIYLSDFQTFPISVGLRMYQSMAGTWANLMMATAIIALIPVAVLFVCAQRAIMRGLGVVAGQSVDGRSRTT